MRINLTVKAGPHEGEVFEFQERAFFVVGRSERANFRLPVKDNSISRIHFMIEMNPPQCRLTDMDSTNGTRVNGQKVAMAVDPGPVGAVHVGQTALGRVHLDHEVDARDTVSFDRKPEVSPFRPTDDKKGAFLELEDLAFMRACLHREVDAHGLKSAGFRSSLHSR